MPKTRTEKIASIDKEMALLAEQRKMLLEAEKAQERKDRTKRLCKRAGLIESVLPATKTLTDEQFTLLLEMTLFSDEGRGFLKELTGEGETVTITTEPESAAAADTPAAEPEPTATAAQDTARAEPQGAGAAAHPNHRHNQKPHHTAQNGGTGTQQNGNAKPTE